MDEIVDVVAKGGDSEKAQALKTAGWVSYVLHLVVAVGALVPGAQAGAVLLIVALVVDMVKKDEAVGTTVSLVTVVDAADAAAGPVFVAVSCTPPAASCGCTVPSAQPVMVTVNVVPVAASGVNVQPVAVPAFEKSPAASPEMDSDIVSA